MIKFHAYKTLVVVFLLLPWTPAWAAADLEVDHGELAAEHNHDTQKFIDDNLKKDGNFSSEKIAAFLEHLKTERKILQKDL